MTQELSTVSDKGDLGRLETELTLRCMGESITPAFLVQVQAEVQAVLPDGWKARVVGIDDGLEIKIEVPE